MASAFQSNAFQDNAFQIDDAAAATTARGGGTYLTREEMREMARRQRVIDKKRRKDEDDLEETIREAYAEIKSPGLKARVAESVRLAKAELDDEEALLTMILHHYGTLH